MITSVRVEPVTGGERAEFLRMAARYFQELNPDFSPNSDWQASYFENIRKDPNCHLRWIVSHDQKTGFILFGVEDHRFLPRKTGVIWELYIIPKVRRRGIARKCAQMAIEEMSTFYPSKIRLEVASGNKSAVSFWKSLGFRKASETFVITMPSDLWK